MKRGLVRWMVCLLVVALTGCRVPLDDWAREFGTALCRHEQECRRVSTSVDCTRPSFWNGWPEELEAHRQGLVSYSAADARRCIDLLSKVGCIDNLKSRLFSSAECRAAFPGQVAEGKPCMPAAVEVCGRDLRCERPTAPDVCGTCVPTARVGEEVTSSSFSKECGLGLYPATDGGRVGLYSTGVCQPMPSIGESCSFRRPCLEWLDCSSLFDGGTCDSVGPPDAGAGEPGEECRDTSRWPWCAWPAACEAGRCADRTARLGDPCGISTQCELSGSCIDGVCVESAHQGESCARTGCTALLFCEDSVCQPNLLVCR